MQVNTTSRLQNKRKLRAVLRASAVGAGLLLSIGAAQATTFCVSTTAQLRTALSEAGQGGISQGEHNTIQLVRGTYNLGGKRLVYNNGSDTHTLEINGGYNDDCSGLIKRASLTVLDAGGNSPVMQTDSHGDVAVRYLTLQNGVVTSQGFSGLSMNTSGGNGGVFISHDIFRNNVGGYYAVGAGEGGQMQVDNNLFVGNSAEFAAVTLSSTGTSVYVTNNTLVQNSVTVDGLGTAILQLDLLSTHTTGYLTNNILWSNGTGTMTQDIYASGATGGGSALHLADNDYASFGENNVASSGTGNHDVDPQFVGANNFRLTAGSPLLGIGTLTPPGGIANVDVYGNPRTTNNTVDLGAYESTGN